MSGRDERTGAELGTFKVPPGWRPDDSRQTCAFLGWEDEDVACFQITIPLVPVSAGEPRGDDE